MIDPTVQNHHLCGPKLTAAIFACAGTALISLMWIVLRTPPHPYYGVLLIICSASVIVGVGIILGGLIARTEARLDSLHTRLTELSDRYKKLSVQQERDHDAIENANEQIDDLRIAFIEEGVPNRQNAI